MDERNRKTLHCFARRSHLKNGINLFIGSSLSVKSLSSHFKWGIICAVHTMTDEKAHFLPDFLIPPPTRGPFFEAWAAASFRAFSCSLWIQGNVTELFRTLCRKSWLPTSASVWIWHRSRPIPASPSWAPWAASSCLRRARTSSLRRLKHLENI